MLKNQKRKENQRKKTKKNNHIIKNNYIYFLKFFIPNIFFNL